jgi:ABC-type amino acid transport system permease subunit
MVNSGATMQPDWESAAIWVIAIVIVVVACIGVREWSRVRQFKENLKANGRRK